MSQGPLGSWEHRASNLFHVVRLDSIKNKIMAFALLATLIPSLFTAWISYGHNKRALTEKTTAELQNISSVTARETDLWLKERFYDVRVFSNSYVVSENIDRILRARRASTGDAVALRRLNDYLNSVRERFTAYEELSILDPQAGAVASSADQAGEPNLPADWLSQVAQDEEIHGEPYWDELLQQVILTIAVPVKAPDGRFLGALTAKLNFGSIDEVVRSLALGESGHVYLLNEDGAVMVSSRLVPAALLRVELASETVRAFAHPETASLEYTDPLGNDVVGTLNEVPDLGWSAVAELTTEEAFVQIAELRNQTLSSVVVLVLSIGLMAYLLGLTIVRPLNRLTDGAAQVAKGDLEIDLPVVTRGELGSMTRVFNDMVARLRSGREELERLSITDDLTGLYNRRHVMSVLGAEVARFDRQAVPFAVLMVDIDHFKKYNDSFGHQAGDAVLARIGALFLDQLREVDCAARYGGEEFLITLPQTKLERAVEVAERIQARVAKEKFAGKTKQVSITLSVGAAEYPEHGDTPELVVAAADAALYQAKRRGRNRVVRAVVATRKKATRPRGKQARRKA